MADSSLITKAKLKTFYDTKVKPYLGGNSLSTMPDVNLTSPSDGQVLTYDNTNSEWKNADATGGHTIKNSSGTSMTQRNTMQFSSPITVTDDSTNEKTVINVDTDVSFSDIVPPAVQPDGINSHYAISSTAASTIAKKATSFDGAFSLVEGTKVFVRFSAKNSATSPTLSIDDSTAKPIKGFGTTKPSSWWVAGDVVQFIYDGTSWIMQPTQGQISEVNSALAEEYEKSVTGVNTYAVKSNDIVTLEIVFSNATITGATTILTLDSEVRPATNKSVVGVIEVVTGGVGSVQAANFIIGANGTVQCSGNITNGYGQVIAIYKTA